MALDVDFSFEFLVAAGKNKTRIQGGPVMLPCGSPVHNSNMIVQTSSAPTSPQVTLIEADTSTIIPKLETRQGTLICLTAWFRFLCSSPRECKIK